MQPAGQPEILDDYGRALKAKAAGVRDMQRNLSAIASNLNKIMDDGWQRSFQTWIARKSEELTNVANHFDSAAGVYSHLADEIRRTNTQLNAGLHGGVAPPFSALSAGQNQLFDASFVVRNQAAATLNKLAGEAPQEQAARAIAAKTASHDDVLNGLLAAGALVIGIGLLIASDGLDEQVLGSDSEGTAALSEAQIAEESRESAWERYLTRKGAEGVDPLTREQWDIKYDTILRNSAQGADFEEKVLNSLGETPDGSPWQTRFSVKGVPGRIIDIGNINARIAYETKSGNAINGGADVLTQLSKDEQLLSKGWSVTWISESEPAGTIAEKIWQMKLQYPNFDLRIVSK